MSHIEEIAQWWRGTSTRSASEQIGAAHRDIPYLLKEIERMAGYEAIATDRCEGCLLSFDADVHARVHDRMVKTSEEYRRVYAEEQGLSSSVGRAAV